MAAKSGCVRSLGSAGQCASEECHNYSGVLYLWPYAAVIHYRHAETLFSGSFKRTVPSHRINVKTNFRHSFDMC